MSSATASSGFPLHAVTVDPCASLDIGRVALRFPDGETEADFVRFRTGAGRVAAALCCLALACAFYAVRGGTYGAFVTVGGAAVCGAAFVAELPLVACADTASSVQRHALVARRHEVITVSAWAVFVLCVAFDNAANIRDGICGDAADPDECVYGRETNVVTMGACTVLLAPRIAPLLAVNALGTVAMLLGNALRGYYPQPLDYVVDAVTVAGWFLAFGIVAWALERHERLHFVAIVRLRRADDDTSEQVALMRAVLESALPAALLDDLTARMDHASADASVGVADIASFAEWSTGLLVINVVRVLHLLTAKYDDIVSRSDGVERAMTYGDSYVTCVGLLKQHVEHAAAAIAFAGEQLAAARSVNELGDVRVFVRVAVGIGKLVGATYGGGVRRYFVSGPAFDAARQVLGGCGPNQLLVVDGVASHAETERDAMGSVLPDAEDGARTATVAPATYAISPCGLAFEDDAVQQGMDGSRVSDLPNALSIAVVITATALGVAVEQAIPDPRRHHESAPLAVALLLAALAAAWGHVAAVAVGRRRAGERFALPRAADTALTADVVALYGVALVFLDCYFAEPSSGFITFVMLRRLPGHRWYTQAALIGGPSFAAAWAWYLLRAQRDAFATAVGFVIYPAVFVAYRYVAVRGECVHFEAGLLAAGSFAAAERRADDLAQLLLGVLPPHVLPDVHVAAGRARGASRGEDHIQRWAVNTLSVAQVALRFAAADVRTMRAAWRAIVEAVRVVELLELVQATGDAFLVAGPFAADADELRCVAGARAVMLLLRALRRALHGTCAFTAVASAGSAVSSLLGAAGLTYRLFGPVVRETDALLAAAPTPLDAALCVTFVTEAFRRQERNFVVVRYGASHDAGLSVAIKSAASAPVDGTPRKHQTSASSLHWRARFADPLMWRARGVGATPVSAVLFDGAADVPAAP
jgi:hypothetical protein